MKRSLAYVLPAVAALAVAGPAGSALVFAGPASADTSPLNGTYVVDGGDDDFYTTFSSNCATEGCKANIASNRGWTSIATLTSGRWNFTVSKPDGIVCGDGSYAPVVILYSIDATTLNGILTTDSNGECPGGQITEAPFHLHKVA